MMRGVMGLPGVRLDALPLSGTDWDNWTHRTFRPACEAAKIGRLVEQRVDRRRRKLWLAGDGDEYRAVLEHLCPRLRRVRPIRSNQRGAAHRTHPRIEVARRLRFEGSRRFHTA